MKRVCEGTRWSGLLALPSQKMISVPSMMAA